jgi:hypothetical protein
MTTACRHYIRIGGLLAPLFTQPLSRIVAMRTNPVTVTAEAVQVELNAIAVQMPAVLDELIRSHLQRRGKSLYASRKTGGGGARASSTAV